MRVLVGCEQSGVVRDSFIRAGHDAISCDLEPSDSDFGPHYQGDVRDLLDEPFDLGIFHPPCTYLSVCGNKWLKPEYESRFPTRKQDRQDAVEFFMTIANCKIPRVAIENPVGVMSSIWRKPDQIVCPTMFGHEEPKRTCLWLKDLPKLIPSKIVEPDYIISKSGKRLARWYYAPSQSPERQKMRSVTFQGIADAMVFRWGQESTSELLITSTYPESYDMREECYDRLQAV